MNLQYISNARGETTGIFIPITDSEKLKTKYADLEDDIELHKWQKDLLDKRITEYRKNSEQVLDFDTVINEIEKEL